MLHQKAKLNINDYRYELPEERIAKYPLPERDKSKLLVYKSGQISDSVFSEIDSSLPGKSLLVFNNTRVIQARLPFQKPTGANIEIFCLEPVEPQEYTAIFNKTTNCTWKCLVGNLKKWKNARLTKQINVDGQDITLSANKIEPTGNAQIISFTWNGSVTFGKILKTIGATPIPPYLKRASEEIDKTRYQTVYSKNDGSVAAPTAGLHFTKNVLDKITEKGHQKAEITLHVGAGTFQPVITDDPTKHPMHTEYFSVNKQTLLALQQNAGSIIPVGTTSLRCLESLYWLGMKIYIEGQPSHVKQFEYQHYEVKLTPGDSIQTIINYLNNSNLNEINCSTQMMIIPGYTFRLINGLITNFHQPKSTLLLLVAAFIGDDWKKVYEYALENEFRFLSYGDGSVLFSDKSNIK